MNSIVGIVKIVVELDKGALDAEISKNFLSDENLKHQSTENFKISRHQTEYENMRLNDRTRFHYRRLIEES